MQRGPVISASLHNKAHVNPEAQPKQKSFSSRRALVTLESSILQTKSKKRLQSTRAHEPAPDSSRAIHISLLRNRHLNDIVGGGVRQLLQHNQVHVLGQVPKLRQRLHLQRKARAADAQPNTQWREKRHETRLTSADSSTVATLKLELRGTTSSLSFGNALNIAMLLTSVAAMRSCGRSSRSSMNMLR